MIIPDQRKKKIAPWFRCIRMNPSPCFVRVLLCQPHTLNSSPLLIRGGFENNSMALSNAEITSLISRWPSSIEDLPQSVRATYDAWAALTVADLNGPIRALSDDPGVEFTIPRRYFPKHVQCVTLTAHGKAPAGEPSPLPAELRSLLDTNPSALLERRLKAMEEQLIEAQSTIASLTRQQDALDEHDVSADYDIHEEVVRAVPKSFLEHLPLSKKERHQILRKQIGKFPDKCWPNALVLKDVTKNSKDVQKAQKLSLTQYATEVSKFMLNNDTTTKMAATSWSHILDLRDECDEKLEGDPDAWLRADGLRDHLVTLADHAHTAFRLGLEASVQLRLNVAKKVDVAMGIAHLRVDPTKREKDDFISDDTYKLVETAAKNKQNLVWAKAGTFPDMQAGRFFGQPPPQGLGGGKRKRGKGHGRGYGDNPYNGTKRSKPKGKGKGKSMDVKSEQN